MMEEISQRLDNVELQFGQYGSVLASFDMYAETIKPNDGFVAVKTRGLGSSFIAGHPVWGRVGSGTPYTVTGSQPYIGDSRGTFDIVRLEAPEGKFFMTMVGSELFKNVNTATFNDGLIIPSGENVDIYFYMGNDTLNSVTVRERYNLANTNIDYDVAVVENGANINMSVTSDNGSNFKSVTGDKDDYITFDNGGNVGFMRLTANGGSAFIKQVAIEYDN